MPKFSKTTFLIYPANYEEKIGFDYIREMLVSYCISEMGIEEATELHFCSEVETITRKLHQIDELMQLSQTGIPFPIRDYNDLRPEFHRIRIEGTVISLESLFDFKPSLRALQQILKFTTSENAADFHELCALSEGIHIESQLFKEVERLVDEKGQIPDNASPELAAIRRDIRRKTNNIDKRIRQILNEAKNAGWVDSNSEVTIRNGRSVIPVKVNDKRHLRGFIHDESATGQTVYIEPTEIFDTNNELKELEYAEKRAIQKILSEFTTLIRPHLPMLFLAWKLLGMIDFIRAKMLLAKKTQAIVPAIVDKPYINWVQARHPILEQKLKEQNKSIVPLDLKLDNENRILVISGPNAGGKSVCLKTTGLLQYMLQCGLAVPMNEKSECGIFDKLFIDIGDEQSLENDLSTYSSHLINAKTMLENSDGRSLFMIDEFGTGTEPQLGGAIAEAVLNELNEKKAFGVVTTHYANLKLVAENSSGIINGAMLFDTKSLRPVYMLSVGKPGSSFAFEIAQKIGFPQKTLEEAANITGKSHLDFEQQLQQLEIEKKEIAKKQHEIKLADELFNEVIVKYKLLNKQLEDKKKELLANANREAKALIDQANRKIEHTIKEIREAQAEKEKTKTLRRDLQQFKEEIETQVRKTNEKRTESVEKQTVDVSDMKPGDMVIIEEMEVVGELLSITENDAVILFNSITLRTSSEKLKKISQATARKQLRNQTTKKTRSAISEDLNEKVANFNLTIDLRGKRVEEAIEQVAKYLDEALLLGIKEISILHGKGNGILRKIIREYLSRQKSVVGFSDASLETGGSGITRVSLR
ncbi:MAG: Smr/MutS family protein [Lentimicrobiaceae bacterium]|nr:Smr/MutS family protein [Lentimicrobiaceae bacterium]